jgi:Protein of unknown function (DUF3168)
MSLAPIDGASLTLQQAIYLHLTSDTVLMAHINAVVDFAPDEQPLPFVQMGADIVSDAATKTEDGSDHRLTFDVWNEYGGQAQTKYLLERLKARLITFDAVPGYRLTIWRFGLAQVLRSQDGTSHHGILEFRARLRPN